MVNVNYVTQCLGQSKYWINELGARVKADFLALKCIQKSPDPPHVTEEETVAQDSWPRVLRKVGQN